VHASILANGFECNRIVVLFMHMGSLAAALSTLSACFQKTGSKQEWMDMQAIHWLPARCDKRMLSFWLHHR